MATILIAGDRPGCGKTSLAAGLLLEISGAGRTVAYHKPAPPDADSRFVATVLSGIPGISVLGGTASAAARLLQPGAMALRDTVLVELPDGDDPLDVADALDARVLLVSGYPVGDLQDIVAALGDRAAGIVVNAVPPYRTEASAQAVSLHPRTVVIPEDRMMLAATVDQIAGHLEARWVQEPVNGGALVEHYLIGGNIMDSGPTYFGRYANQAVITRAQRPDIQIACMDSDIRCLLLTGPGEASEYVKAEARERDIPLLQVPASTEETACSLDGLLAKATAHSPAKARRYASLLRQHAGADTIAALLGTQDTG